MNVTDSSADGGEIRQTQHMEEVFVDSKRSL